MELGINGGGLKLQYNLYPWLGNYTLTVKGAPVWSQTDDTAKGQGAHTFKFGKVISAGEYLLVVSLAEGQELTAWSSIYSMPSTDNPDTTKLQFFRNGNVVTDWYNRISGNITYVNDTHTTFGTLSADGVDAKITQAEVTLYKNINIDLTAKVADAIAALSLTAVVTYKDTDYPVELSKSVGADGYTTVTFSFTDILPQDISETLTAKLYADGILIAQKVDYSIQAYCEGIMPAPEDTDNAALRSLLIALLNYGAESQKYFNGETDAEALANSSLSDAEITSVNKAMSGALTVKQASTKTDENNCWYSATLGLYNTVRIRLMFYTKNVSQITVMIGGNTVSTFESLGGNVYYLDYDAFAANQFGESVSAVLYVGGTEVQTVTYSVNSYVNSYAANNDNTDASYGFIQAIYDYGVAAKGYAG